MRTILDVKSKSKQIIRFIFTPAGYKTLFGTIREDILTVCNRSIPCNEKPLKQHGTLILGDDPNLVPTFKEVKSLFDIKTLNIIKKWINIQKKEKTDNG